MDQKYNLKSFLWFPVVDHISIEISYVCKKNIKIVRLSKVGHHGHILLNSSLRDFAVNIDLSDKITHNCIFSF